MSVSMFWISILAATPLWRSNTLLGSDVAATALPADAAAAAAAAAAAPILGDGRKDSIAALT